MYDITFMFGLWCTECWKQIARETLERIVAMQTHKQSEGPDSHIQEVTSGNILWWSFWKEIKRNAL